MKIINSILLLFMLLQPAFAEDTALPDAEYLKVCADPYMLPMSNHKEEAMKTKSRNFWQKN